MKRKGMLNIMSSIIKYKKFSLNEKEDIQKAESSSIYIKNYKNKWCKFDKLR